MRRARLSAAIAVGVLLSVGLPPGTRDGRGPAVPDDQAPAAGRARGTGSRSMPILTAGDVIGQGSRAYQMSGIPDGLGLYRSGPNTVEVWMNHELGGDPSNARVSHLTLDDDGAVIDAEYVINGREKFKDFCSSTSGDHRRDPLVLHRRGGQRLDLRWHLDRHQRRDRRLGGNTSLRVDAPRERRSRAGPIEGDDVPGRGRPAQPQPDLRLPRGHLQGRDRGARAAHDMGAHRQDRRHPLERRRLRRPAASGRAGADQPAGQRHRDPPQRRRRGGRRLQLRAHRGRGHRSVPSGRAVFRRHRRRALGVLQGADLQAPVRRGGSDAVDAQRGARRRRGGRHVQPRQPRDHRADADDPGGSQLRAFGLRRASWPSISRPGR